MNLRFLPPYRIAILISLGIAVALTAAFWVFVHLRVDPKKLHLSDRLDPTTVVLYVSTPDRSTLFSTLQRYQSRMPDIYPAPTDIKNADLYEFALVRSGSGHLSWIFYGLDTKEGKHTTVLSENNPSLFLPLSERQSSLSHTPLFGSQKTGSSFVWFTTADIPLPNTVSTTIIRAFFSPYKEGLISFDTSGGGRLILLSDKPPAIGSSFMSLQAFLAPMIMALHTNDPALREGLTGIVKAHMEKMTGSTDLLALAGDFLSEPLALTLAPGEGDTLVFAVAGTATKAKAIDMWLGNIASVRIPGNVRRMEFFKKEYTRIDVTADETSDLRSAGEYRGWTLQHLGGSGADLSLVVATSGRKYVIGSNDELVRSLINANASERNASVSTGNIDVAGLVQNMEKNLPFLQPLRPTVEVLLGPSPSHLTWRLSPIPRGIGIDWTLTRADMMNHPKRTPQQNLHP